MQSNEPRQRKPISNEFAEVPNDRPLDKDEFNPLNTHPDFWGVHAVRFNKGLIDTPIAIEHPKNTTNLSKLMQESTHYFVMEDIGKRSIACTTCPIKHGGILEAHELIHYRLEDGVLYYKDKAINRTP